MFICKHSGKWQVYEERVLMWFQKYLEIYMGGVDVGTVPGIPAIEVWLIHEVTHQMRGLVKWIVYKLIAI